MYRGYCDTCAFENDWPETNNRTIGICERCGNKWIINMDDGSNVFVHGETEDLEEDQ